MKATFDYTQLCEAVSSSFSTIDPKSLHLERYQFLNVRFEESTCFIRASNMRMQTEISLPMLGSEGTSGWSFWVNGKVFKDLISSLKGGDQLTIAYASGNGMAATASIDVASGKSLYKVKTAHGFEAEPFFQPHPQDVAEIDIGELIAAISQVSCFSVEDTSARFHGIHINPISFLATDGKILAIRNNIGVFPTRIPVALDQKSVHRLIKFFKTTTGKVRAAAEERCVYFETDTLKCSINQLSNAGKFPGYKSILDATLQNNKATIERSDFIERLKRVLLFADESSRVWLEFLENKDFCIKVQSGTMGEAFETLSYTGEAFSERLLMNGRSLLDILGQLEKPQIDMYVGKTPTPVRFEEGQYACLALPMIQREV